MTQATRTKPTNFANKPQIRKAFKKGGTFQWKRTIPFVMIAAQEYCIRRAGGVEALCQYRDWSDRWGLTADHVLKTMYEMFPGLDDFLKERIQGQTTSVARLFHSRWYKPLYNGTSARGDKHDPTTRAAPSIEYWRSWQNQDDVWVKDLMKSLDSMTPIEHWRDWL